MFALKCFRSGLDERFEATDPLAGDTEPGTSGWHPSEGPEENTVKNFARLC